MKATITIPAGKHQAAPKQAFAGCRRMVKTGGLIVQTRRLRPVVVKGRAAYCQFLVIAESRATNVAYFTFFSLS